MGRNKPGEYELSSTEVRVEVSSKTDREMVIADAIHRLPVK